MILLSLATWHAVQAQKQHILTVNPKPTVEMRDTALCRDGRVRVVFTGQPPFVVNYTVNSQSAFAIGLPDRFDQPDLQQTATHTYTAEIKAGQTGLWTFELISLTDNGDCINTDPQTAIVEVLPLPTVQAATDTGICQDGKLRLHFTGMPPFSVVYTEPTLGQINLTVHQTTDTAISFAQTGDFYLTLFSLFDGNNDCYGRYDTTNSTAAIHLRVYDKPVITNTVLSEEACSGAGRSVVLLYADQPDTVFTWTTRNPGGNITGYTPDGTGNYLTAEILTNTSHQKDTLIYYLVAHNAAHCASDTVEYIVVVNPDANAMSTSTSETLCSGDTVTAAGFTSSVQGAVFEWTSVAQAAITGNTPSGTGNLPTDVLINSGNIAATVVYTVTPKANNCQGTPLEYVVTVHPQPFISLASYRDTICAKGVLPAVSFYSTVAGVSYAWTSSASAQISGNTVSGTGFLPPDMLDHNGSDPDSVTYKLSAQSLAGCLSDTIHYTVYVNPVPSLILAGFIFNDTICSGNVFTAPIIQSAVGGTVYNWTVSTSGLVSGINQYSGTGAIPVLPLHNHGSAQADVTYRIVPSYNGCADTATFFQVVVHPQPMLTNPVLTETVCSGASRTTVTLSANASNASFAWISSAAASITGNTPAGTGDLPPDVLINNGNVPDTAAYKIMVRTEGNCVSDTVLYVVTVHPAAQFTYPQQAEAVCSGDAFGGVNWTADVANTAFAWTASSASLTGFLPSGNGNIPAATYVNTGNDPDSIVYTVKAEANGCTGDSVRYILTVNPIPDVQTAQATDSICSQETFNTITFTSDVSGASFAWTSDIVGEITGVIPASGVGNINGVALTNYGNTSGTVTYTVLPSANGCVGTAFPYVLSVLPKPRLTNSSLAETACSGASRSSVSLTENIGGATFEWFSTASSSVSGNTAFGTGDLPADVLVNTSSLPETVTYRIVVRTDLCASDTTDYIVTVNPSPSAALTGSQTICASESADLIILSGVAPWTVTCNDGVSDFTLYGIMSSPYRFTPPSAGVFTFKLVNVSDVSGCTAITTDSAVITVTPAPTIKPAASQTIIQGDSMALFVLTGVSPWTITYTNGTDTFAVTATESPYIFNPQTAGSYTFTLISVSDADCINYAFAGESTVITVDSFLLSFDEYVIVKWNNLFMLNNRKLDQDGYRYTSCAWFENGALLDTGSSYAKGNSETDVFITGAIYHFELTTPEGRIIRSTDKVFQPETHQIIVYPNPVSRGAEVTINLGNAALPADASIRIYSINGSLVRQTKAQGQHTRIAMDLPAGMYMIHVTDKVFKVVVQ
jgi:hypothetical protein